MFKLRKISGHKAYFFVNTLCLVFLLCFNLSANGQNGELGIPASNMYLGITAYSNGFGLSATHQSNYSVKNMQKNLGLNVRTFRHPKEFRTTNTAVQNPAPYVYGKQYFTMVSNMNFGLSKMLLSRNSWFGAALGVQANLGVNMATQRPVYLELVRYSSQDQIAEYYSERYDPNKHKNRQNITGYSNSEGWNQLRYRWGFHSDLAINLYWGGYGTALKQVKFGINFDYFLQDLEIMAATKNEKLNTGLFVTFGWGLKKS